MYLDVAAENIPKEVLDRIMSKRLLPSREVIRRRIAEWFELISKTEGVSKILVIRGEWGYGKTALRSIVEGLAKEHSYGFLYIRTEDLLRKASEVSTNIPTIAFEEVIISELERLGISKAVIFLDELEGMKGLEESNLRVGGEDIVQAFISFLRDILSREGKYGTKLRSRVHLVIAATPHALHDLQVRLRSLGYHGWLIRREDIIDLKPLSKLEVITLVSEILKDIYGIEINDVFTDVRLVESLYMISQGNIGTLISLLNSVLLRIKGKCKELRENKVSDVRISPIDLIEIYSSKRISVGEKPDVNILSDSVKNTLGNILRMSNKYLIDRVTFLVASTSILRGGEIKDTDELIRLIKFNTGLDTVKVDIYYLSESELREFITNFIELIKRLIPFEGIEEEPLRASLENLIHLVNKGLYAIAIPRVSEELRYALSYHGALHGLRIDERVIKELNNLLSGREHDVGIMLSYSSLYRVYPICATGVIPFLSDPSEANTVIKNALELYGDAQRFNEVSALVKNALMSILIDEGIIAVDERYRPRLKIDGKLTPIPVDVYCVMTPLSQLILGKCREDDKRLCLIFHPRGMELKYLADLSWNTKLIQLNDVDLILLISLTLSRKHRYRVDKEGLRKFRTYIIDNYRINELIREWYAQAIELGIIVPSELRGAINFEGHKENPIIKFLNHYTLLLLGGDKFLKEDLYEIIYYLYRTSVFKKQKQWHGINIPSFFSVDLEPENPEVLSRDKVISRIESHIIKAINSALESSLLTMEGGYYKVVRHPVERRVLNVLRSGAMEINDLIKSKFIVLDNRAYHILRDFFIELLRRKGDVKLKRSKGKVIISLSSDEDLKDVLHKRYEEYSKIIESLKRNSHSLNIIEDPKLHILITKKKGWKLITLSIIHDNIGKLMEIVENKPYKSLISMSIEYLEYCTELLNKVLIPNYFKIIELHESIHQKLKDIESHKNRLVDALESLSKSFANEFLNIMKDIIKDLRERYVDEADRLFNITLDDLIEEIRYLWRRNNDELIKTFYYEHEDVNQHNYVLVKLRQLENSLRNEAQIILHTLDSIDNNLHDIKAELQGLNRIRELALVRIRNRLDSAEVSNLNDVNNEISGIKKYVSEFRRKYKKTTELLNKLSRLKSTIIDKQKRLERLKERVKKLEKDLINIRKLVTSVGNKFKYEFEPIISSIDKLMSGASNEIENLGRLIGEYDERYKELLERTEGITSSLEALSYNVEGAEKEIKYLENELNRLSNKVKRECEGGISKITNSVERAFANALNNVIKSVETLESMCDKLSINYYSMGMLRKRLNELRVIYDYVSSEELNSEELLKIIRDRVIPTLKGLDPITDEIKELIISRVGEDTLRVYEVVMDVLKTGRGSVSLRELIRLVSDELNMSDDKVLKILLELNERGVINIIVSSV